MIQDWRGPFFSLMLPTGGTVNFWDMARCDEILAKTDFK